MNAWTEERLCKTCGKPFAARVADVMGRPFGTTQCSDCAALAGVGEEELVREAERVAHKSKVQLWVATCGLHLRYWTATFESWRQREPAAELFQICQAYADQFPVDRPPVMYRSLWLYSEANGLGKTHLAAAIIHRILERSPRDKCPVRYVRGPALQLRVRRANEPPPPDTWRESEADIYEDLRGVPLLVLDDAGDPTGSPGEYSRRVYHHIIDERYSDGLPLVLCSNVSTQRLREVIGPAAFDRLREMVQGNSFELTGEKSWREEA